MENSFIYRPPETIIVKVDLKVPWNGKYYKVTEVSLRDYKNLHHFLDMKKMIVESGNGE